MGLFSHKNLNLGIYCWGLGFEHKFTSKNA
jgi:hypothetical protein